jgi:hypothetical protein
MVQLDKRRDGDARYADLHARASDRIQHPSGDNDDHTRRCLEINDAARPALLAVVSPNPTSIQRMPAIMDLDLLPDMGRMTP